MASHLFVVVFYKHYLPSGVKYQKQLAYGNKLQSSILKIASWVLSLHLMVPAVLSIVLRSA